MADKKTKYSYQDMITDCMNYIPMADFIPADKKVQIMDKLGALADSYTKKAEYAAAHRKPSQAKGASADTKARAQEIAAVLTDTPMTSSEINIALGKDYSALQIANAVKYIEGAEKSKVIRETVTKAGLRAEREYTAYFLA